MSAGALSIVPVPGVPEVREGDDLATLLLDALDANGLPLQDGDVLVVSSKVFSKMRGLVTTSTDKEAVVRAESEYVVAERALSQRPTQIVKAIAGPVMAAAGVDGSNTGGHEHWLLLPHDPDGETRALCAALRERTGVACGVIMSDTSGRAWRLGQTDFALGVAGTPIVDDLRGGVDADGRPLEVTTRAVADEVAAAADLVKGKISATPAALVRGLPFEAVDVSDDAPGGRALVRTGRVDWFSYGRVESVRAALGIEPGSRESKEVGMASVRPEERVAKVGRAARTAMLHLDGTSVDVGPERAVLSAETPVLLGRLLERFRAALWCEWLACEVDEALLADPQVREVAVTVRSSHEPVAEDAPETLTEGKDALPEPTGVVDRTAVEDLRGDAAAAR